MKASNYKKSKLITTAHTRRTLLIACLAVFLFTLQSNAQTAADNATITSTSSQKNKTTIMKEKDFSTTILVDQSPTEVFNAVNNVRAWWPGEIAGGTDKLNDEFTYEVKDIHYSKQKIVEIIPNKKVTWLITGSKLSYVQHKEEWTGTTITFDISKEGEKTKLTFTHHGLVPAFECYDGCSGTWEPLIQKSLFSLITTGKGVNIFQK